LGRHRFSPWTVLALAGVLSTLVRIAAPAQDGGERPEPAADQAPTDALREEYFVVEQPATAAERATKGREESTDSVGLVCCRRLALDDGWQVEWDVRFPAEETRLLQIERHGSTGTSLVWREMRPGAGRTLTAEWSEEGDGLIVREWSGRQRREEELPARTGAILPLHLLELLREDTLADGRLLVFDPLSRSLDAVTLRTTLQDDATRSAELVRDDGTLAGVWQLDGERLLSFQWQGGDLRARRISRDEYRERLEPVPDVARR